MPQPAAEQRHWTRAGIRQRFAITPRWRAVAVARYPLKTVKEGEVPLFLRQSRNEVPERYGDGEPDTPPVTISDTEQHAVANQRGMVSTTAAETQNCLGEDKTNIVLQALAQAICPMSLAVRVAGPCTNPNSPVVPELDGRGRDVVGPEIEGPAADKVKARVMPVASQNPIFDRAPMQRKAKMRATIVEREELVPIMYDEQRARAAADDCHAPRPQLPQCTGAYPTVSRRFETSVVAGLGYRGPPR